MISHSDVIDEHIHTIDMVQLNVECMIFVPCRGPCQTRAQLSLAWSSAASNLAIFSGPTALGAGQPPVSR